jgi:hypothetical protein
VLCCIPDTVYTITGNRGLGARDHKIQLRVPEVAAGQFWERCAWRTRDMCVRQNFRSQQETKTPYHLCTLMHKLSEGFRFGCKPRFGSKRVTPEACFLGSQSHYAYFVSHPVNESPWDSGKRRVILSLSCPPQKIFKVKKAPSIVGRQDKERQRVRIQYCSKWRRQRVGGERERSLVR